MSKAIFILWLAAATTISPTVRAQILETLPTEDLISTKSSTVTYENKSDYANMKSAYLYYNESVVLLFVAGSKGPARYYIQSKRYESTDHQIIITCFDSSTMARLNPEQRKSTPPFLVVEIDYNFKMNGKTLTDVTCRFISNGLRYNFGFDAKSDKAMMEAVKRKYNRSLSAWR